MPVWLLGSHLTFTLVLEPMLLYALSAALRLYTDVAGLFGLYPENDLANFENAQTNRQHKIAQFLCLWCFRFARLAGFARVYSVPTAPQLRTI